MRVYHHTWYTQRLNNDRSLVQGFWIESYTTWHGDDHHPIDTQLYPTFDQAKLALELAEMRYSASRLRIASNS